ncbi:hypothetical protein P7C73_g5476, partial [Tremellales sp. Uapishka_1]
MASTATDIPGATPLYIPAILQNPTNPSLRQVAAHNAQQREKLQARKETRSAPTVLLKNNTGKRIIRRRENANFVSNPHITPPSKSDLQPPFPLHAHRPRASFPRDLPLPANSDPIEPSDPYSCSSLSGAFTTSLKGTRAMLRKRGRRAEVVVMRVENEIKDWLAGKGWNLGWRNDDDEGWKVIDETMVEYEPPESKDEGSSRRMHERLRHATLPKLEVVDGKCRAILELSRSPAHLSWAVADNFERLVVHLVARYYELVSWSENITHGDSTVRMTHIILPTLIKPKAPVGGYSLITPENSDLSAPSSSDNASDTEAETGTETETETEIGDETLRDIHPSAGAHSPASSLHSLPDISHLSLHLQRTISTNSSAYASSEGGSDWENLGDSLTFPAAGTGGGGWTRVESDEGESEFGAGTRLPVTGGGAAAHGPSGGGRTAGDKLGFFEYLFE